VKSDLLESIDIKDLWPEHPALHVLPILGGQARIHHLHPAGIHNELDVRWGVDRAFQERSPNEVMITECAKQTGFEDVNDNDRTLRVDQALFT
jgi:hypothetical protein